MSKDESHGQSLFARIIIQQCISAKLQINANAPNENPAFISIGRGIVVYICFLKDAIEETAIKMAKSVCNIKLSKSLSEESNSSLVSVVELPGDILVVPQATLGGKQKGNRMQYHGNINKKDGEKLYRIFVETLRNIQDKNESCRNNNVRTESGTYGNLQVLSVETNGPYTHVLNF
ncbi:D-aminoacyl-tRNA deacylase 2-like [Styela clava]